MQKKYVSSVSNSMLARTYHTEINTSQARAQVDVLHLFIVLHGVHVQRSHHIFYFMIFDGILTK